MEQSITPEQETRTYLVERDNETLKITVPSHWKVTYGPIVPGTRFRSEYALRFYEGKENQRAIFTNVRSFRDLSIPVEKLVVQTITESKRKSDHKTGEEMYTVEREERWEKVN